MPQPLILLAPSEDKKEGGRAGPLIETKAQAWVRKALQSKIRSTSYSELQKVLSAKGDLFDRVLANSLNLHKSIPLLPALERYQGVAFEALDASSIPLRKWRQIFILSNLRGLVRGDHLLPFYKLKMNSLDGLKAHLQKQFLSELNVLPKGNVWSLIPEEQTSIIDSWGRERHTVLILDESGKKISHWSKYYRGLLARWIILNEKGDPLQVRNATLPSCHIANVNDNEYGGKELTIKVKTKRK
ncbi:MAG: peroxide stress protein YaaA [Holophagaceae bacterium]